MSNAGGMGLLVLIVVGCGSRSNLGLLDFVPGEGAGAGGSGGSAGIGGGSAGIGGGVVAVGGNVGSGGVVAAGGSAGNGGGVAVGGSVGIGGGVAVGGSVGIGGGVAVGGGAGMPGSGGAPMSAPRATELALGAFHSCARFEGGSVRCWGANSSGYIGSGNAATIGDDETPDVAGDVDIGGSVARIAAGWYATCALLDSGSVRCWGDGSTGNLGYGNTEDIGDDETPASAGDVQVGGKVASVSVGNLHACVLLENGRVRCWGNNEYWQLGYSGGATIGDDENPVSAGFVDVGGVVVQLAAGNNHTCALLDTGRVRCWGRGVEGKLGYGSMQTIGDDETPASAGDVDVGGNVVQIVAGWLHTCALLETGAVRCWGAGSDGKLGYGNTVSIGDNETPASAGNVDVGGPVIRLAAGDFTTCAVLVGGAVRCWGSGERGGLGYGTTENIGDDETPASAGDVDVGGPVTDIDIGFLHTCALLEDGRVRCWGRGENGALGYGNLDDIGDDETPASAGDVRTHQAR